MIDNDIKELYSLIFQREGIPSSLINAAIEISKHIEEDGTVYFTAGLRKELAQSLGIGLARVTQVIGLLDAHDVLKKKRYRGLYTANLATLFPYDTLAKAKDYCLTFQKNNITLKVRKEDGGWVTLSSTSSW